MDVSQSVFYFTSAHSKVILDKGLVDVNQSVFHFTSVHSKVMLDKGLSRGRQSISVSFYVYLQQGDIRQRARGGAASLTNYSNAAF